MISYRLRCTPLTPIHMGSGATAGALEFVVRDSELLKIDIGKLYARLAPDEQTSFADAAEGGNLKDLRSLMLRHAGSATECAIAASEDFVAAFRGIGQDGQDPPEVSLFSRAPGSRVAYIPGSGVKGALRTALLSELANEQGSTEFVRTSFDRQFIRRLPRDARGEVVDKALSDAASKLERDVLGYGPRTLERDVLRLLAVEDCNLPEGATRIDRIALFHRPGREAVQELPWCERLRSKADAEGATPVSFTLTLRWDDKAAQHPGVRRNLGRQIDFDQIANACNAYYWRRFKSECDTFFRNEAGKHDRRGEALFRTLAAKQPDGRFGARPPKWPGQFLIRIGRFTHFESHSLDNFWMGRRPQYAQRAEEWIDYPEMGWTRALCDVGQGCPTMPLGWMLLELEQ